jgi:hypothetical protein
MTDAELVHALYKEVLLWCADDDGYLTILTRLERARDVRRYKPGQAAAILATAVVELYQKTGVLIETHYDAEDDGAVVIKRKIIPKDTRLVCSRERTNNNRRQRS